MIRINLLPEVKRKAPKRKTKVSLQIPYTWIIASLVAVILAGVVSLLVHLKVTEKLEDRQQQAVSIQKEIENYKVQQSLVEKARKQRNALAQKLEIITILKRRQIGPVRLLDELASSVPSKLWLEEMAEVGHTLTFTGFSLDHIQIASFMESLQKSKLFSNVELISASASKSSGRRGVSGGAGFPVKAFEITCTAATVVRAQ